LKYVLRKNKYTSERGAGLGWVVAASFSVICPELHNNCLNYYVWPELPAHWEININHYTIIWMYVLRKNKYTWEKGAGLGWVVAASFSVIYRELHYNCFNYYIMARTSL
jgi:hypothetical protein